jgi:RNA polymerase primary sigma factor
MRKLRITELITDKDERAVLSYFNDLSHLKMLTPAEENEIARRAAEGDRQATEALILANLRFVVTVAKKYQHNGLPLADLISEGNIGLIEAAKRFDETKGFKFITYAIWWVRQQIIAAIHEHQQLIRLPVNVHQLKRKAYNLAQVYENTEGRELPYSALREMLELSDERFAEIAFAPGYSQSLDQPLTELEGGTLLDVIADDGPSPQEGLEEDESSRNLHRLLLRLPERSRKVLEMVYGLGGRTPLNNREAAEYFDLSPESIRLIRNQAISDCRCLATKK